MPAVLTSASTVGCGHDPGRVGTSSAAKLSVGSARVLLSDSIATKAVSVCSTPVSDKTQPCATVLTVASGTAAKLTAGGAPVVLATLAGTTDGKPPGTLNSSGTQTKLTAK